MAGPLNDGTHSPTAMSLPVVRFFVAPFCFCSRGSRYLRASCCLRSLSARRGWGLLAALSLRVEGIGGLYRGIGAVMVGGVPGMCLYLTTYEATKGFLADRAAAGSGSAGAAGGGGMLTHLTAGMLAEVVW